MIRATRRLSKIDGTQWARLRALASAALLGALAVGCAGGSSATSRPQDGSGSSSKSKVWKPGVPDSAGPVVAVVGSRRITRHEIDSLILTAPASIQPGLREFDGYRDVVDRVVTQEAMVGAARLSGVEQDEAYKAEVAKAARELLARRYWGMKQKALPAISDSTMKAYYDSNPEEFTLNARARIRHISLGTRKKALQIRASLQKGALWDETCRKQSLDAATRENGGLLGYVAPEADLVPGIGKSPAIAAAAFSLPPGEVSQPLKGPKNWHLIMVESRDEKTIRPFGESRETIRPRFEAEQREAYGKAFVESVKVMTHAVIFDDSIRVALRPAKTAADLFKEAQAAATPLQRIDLYRSLVRDFPNDSVTVQAQFMIGFTFAEELNDYVSARVEFERFVAQHPGTELAESARWMLENMDKPAPPLEGEPEEDSTTGGGTDSVAPDPDSGFGGSGGVAPERAPR